MDCARIVLIATVFFVVLDNAFFCNVGGAKVKTKNKKDLGPESKLSRIKANLPPDYDIVYPYIADSRGKYVGKIDKFADYTSLKESIRTPRSISRRQRRRKKNFVVIETKYERLMLTLKRNKKFVVKNAFVEFLDDEGRRKHYYEYEPCHYIGRLRHQQKSLVALSNCDGLVGLIRTSSADYFIEPVRFVARNSSVTAPHAVYRVETALNWKNISILNDVANEVQMIRKKRSKRAIDDEELPDETINPSTKLYLETMIAADHSVTKFHGPEKTAQYIMNLMNIVSVIYDDPSLNSNIHVVVVKIVLVNKSKDNVTIVKNDTRSSLDNVCNWANTVYNENPNASHDIAIFLTRLNIGGPAGYAPLASICDAERSCTINKDEGLTSAFIIAHEIGHVLGLSHDGDDVISGNNCSADGSRGSVMAATVQSYFNRYHWSECSKAQFHKMREFWTCMINKPNETTLLQPPTSLPGTQYSLDDQCRQEFGEGSRHCKSFKIPNPCASLWCGYEKKPLLCKTKKGPPLDGTMCAEGKWCINGFCVRINKRRHTKDTIFRNPQHGEWSDWSPFGHCSRSCGTGAKFRSRKCNNPEPAHRGRYCKGLPEEFQLCNQDICPELRDYRNEQCAYVSRMDQLQKSSATRTSLIPHVSENIQEECKLLCETRKSHELYVTNNTENVIDGTWCSYDGTKNICVQGQCQKVGCNGILGSDIIADDCGVCGGNKSLCKTVSKTYTKTPTKRFTRIVVIPRRARHIVINKTKGAPNVIAMQSRKYREFLLNGDANQDTSKIFVALGAKFNYSESDGQETIEAEGPLLEELTILISVKRIKTQARITSTFTIPVNKSMDSIVGGEDYFVWKTSGWTKCSQACGKGIQILKTLCLDSRTENSVSKRHCSLLDKPTIRKRTCNTIPCTGLFRWKTDEWEHCSQTCGSKGRQQREVYCVFVNATNLSVKSRMCTEEKPPEEQSCNNHPCPSSWTIGSWSQCSVTCGKGFQYRNVTCAHSENDVIYECGEAPPTSKPCERPTCLEECNVDRSDVCQKEELLKYCVISSFYLRCCKTCREYMKDNKLN